MILLGFYTTQWTILARDPAIKPIKNLIQIGSRQQDLDFVIEADLLVIADEATFLQSLDSSGVLDATTEANQEYLERARKLLLRYPIEPINDNCLHPASVVEKLNDFMSDYICVADSGNHRSFATHYWLTKIANGFYSANTICGMGWAIPASIGISFARNLPCLVITGDGCMLMHGIELQTAVRYDRHIVYVIFNNSSYGATYFNNKKNIPEMSELPTHEWAKFAESFGAIGLRAASLQALEAGLQNARKHRGVTVIDVLCSKLPETPAYNYKQRVKDAEVL